MEWLYEVRRRLRVLFRREEFHYDLEEEMRTHLELQAEENQVDGMPPEEARYAARRQFGNVTLLKEVSSDMWGWASVEGLGKDLRYAVRTLRRTPGFTLAVVLVLALGIGASAALFGIANAVLVRSLPFSDRSRLVMVWESNPRATGTAWQPAVRGPGPPVVCGPAFRDWKSQNSVFERIAAYDFFPTRLAMASLDFHALSEGGLATRGSSQVRASRRCGPASR